MKKKRGEFSDVCPHCGHSNFNVDIENIDLNIVERKVEITHELECLDCDGRWSQYIVFKLGECLEDDVQAD